MTKGTIVGNDEDGYYLFSYGGNEVAICYGKGLDKYERAYYGLSFKEENRFFSDRTPGFTIIDNARVGIVETYKVIHPISKTEADKRGITHPDSCSVDKNFDLSDSYGAGDGYFDFYTLATITHDSYTHYEYASVPIDLVYDPARQSRTQRVWSFAIAHMFRKAGKNTAMKAALCRATSRSCRPARME